MLAGMLLFGCDNDKKDITPSKSLALISEKAFDGYIVNSSPRIVYDYRTHTLGKGLNVGWDGNGYAMRAFLSFDISDILPTDNQNLIIENAELKVFELNTNMLPFDGDGNRSISAGLLNYGTLDESDFNMETESDCGVITNWGYNVLKEYPINVTDEIKSHLSSDVNIVRIQFRLQFSNDDNCDLTNAMFTIFSGEEQESTAYNEYRPILEITYHYEDK